MKYQRFVSLSAMLSFAVLALSSGVLYFIPDRKVTSWTDWKFLGLDKQQWDNLHINLGIFFIVMIIWHIYFNWKPIKNYLKVKRKLKIFTREFNVALVLVLLFSVGTIKMVLPFSFLVNIGNGIKAKNSLNDGNPPYGYAEYSTLKDFCLLTSIELKTALEKLKKNGITIRNDKEILKKIADKNGVSPKEIFEMIKNDSTKFDLPTDIPIGIAHKSLERLAREYKIDLDKFIEHLKEYGIEVKKSDTFKKIAVRNSLHPAQLYNMLLASQKR